MRKLENIREKNRQKARGLFTRILSHGKGTVADWLVPNWLYGIFNIAVASEEKGWLTQVMDVDATNHTVAYEEYRSKTTLRTHVKDSGTLYTKTFGADGNKWGDNSTEMHPRLQSAVLTLTKGPVCPSDKIGLSDRVLIMSRNPGRLIGELPVDLPWPRDGGQPAFQALRSQLMDSFKSAEDETPGVVPETQKPETQKTEQPKPTLVTESPKSAA